MYSAYEGDVESSIKYYKKACPIIEFLHSSSSFLTLNCYDNLLHNLLITKKDYEYVKIFGFFYRKYNKLFAFGDDYDEKLIHLDAITALSLASVGIKWDINDIKQEALLTIKKIQKDSPNLKFCIFINI